MATASPVELCNNRIAHFRSKADHNKRESLTFFSTVIMCTLSAPLFITLGNTPLLNKIIPAILSTMAAGATAWLQQRKPQQLWSLYRSAERQIEFHLQRYQLHAGEYADAANPDRLLAEHVTEIVLRTHDGWSGLVPQMQANTPDAKAK
jgi:SMODS and SLOG-associating 2TM effector domain 1